MQLHEHHCPLGKMQLLSRTARRSSGQLRPHDRLLFYTDGLVETRNRAGRFFALDAHVATALATPDLDGAVRGVVKLLLAHAGDGLADDVLLVLGEQTPV